MKNVKKNLLDIMFKAIDASKPDGNFKILPDKPKGRTIIVGAGKAAASMARAFENTYPYHCEGVVVTRYGHSVETKNIKVIEASHPIPDSNGQNATEQIIQKVKNLSNDDLVIFLISGGASALFFSPLKGISFDQKQKINEKLLKSGAPIREMNIVRQSISSVKGGRFAQMIYPGKLITYAISDIPGDDPKFIGSGPTINSGLNVDDAIEILKKYQIDVDDEIYKIIRKYQAPKINKTPFYFVSTPMMALIAAKEEALKKNMIPIILSDKLQGEACIEGQKMGMLALKIKKNKKYKDILLDKPLLLLSGGETSVTIKGDGLGGRNTEFMLSMAKTLNGENGIYGLSIDTDGIDGIMENAGSYISPKTKLKAMNQDLNLNAFLQNNDSYNFFKLIDDLIFTKPTLTNVNDFRAILILP